MTPQPQQEHCEHEKMCSNSMLVLFPIEKFPCDRGNCQYRSSPLPRTGAPITNTEIIRCKKMDCIDYNTELCHPWKCTIAMEKHDIAIRNAAQRELIEELNRQTTGRKKSQILDILFECQTNPEKYLESLRTQTTNHQVKSP